MRDPKILFLDLETAPKIGLYFGWESKTNIAKSLQGTYILQAGMKWGHEDEVKVIDLSDFKTAYRKNKTDDERLVKSVVKNLSEADVVVCHNTDFDVQWIRGKVIKYGLPPILMPNIFCTLRWHRKLTKSDSHRLDAICQDLGIGEKVSTGGIDLWENVMAGDLESIEKMREYCRHDVVLLEKLFWRLVPHTSFVLPIADEVADGETPYCTTCGSFNVVPRKNRQTTGGVSYKQYACSACGSYSSSRKMNFKSSSLKGSQ